MLVHGTLLRAWWAVLVCLAAIAACAADTEKKPPIPCTIEGNNCEAPAKDLRRASDVYWQGVKLREKDLARAYQDFTEAAQLVPGNVDYASAREVARVELAQQHLESGNRLLANGRQVDAVAEFRSALQLDATNEFAQQRLMDALGDNAPRPSTGLRLVERSDPVDLAPRPGRQDIVYRGDARGLYELIGRTFGIKVGFDQSFSSRQVRFDVESVDFAKAMELAGMVSKSMWVPLSENQVLVAANTAENHKQFDRMSLRSFYVSEAATPQELNDVVGLLRSVFDMRLVNATASQNLITVRAPRATADAAAEFLNQLSIAGPPPVMLDVQAFEIDRMVLSNLGIQPPASFSAFSLAGVAALLSSPNVQQLINQLISSGGINQGNTSALQGLLSQLQQQQLNPLLSTPFATFGNGISLMAVTLPSAAANFQFNSSTVKSLQHLTLRALQGKAATMKLGERYPIVNATFAPIYNTPAIASNIQGGTYQAPFPSISYEDLGLVMKATPVVHGSSNVTLELETEIRALTGAAVNGVPVISNRSYKSTITVKDGEAAVVAGYLNHTEQVTLGGIPGLGAIPDLGLLAADQNKTREDDEFMLVVTPHILQAPAGESQAVWLPAGK